MSARGQSGHNIEVFVSSTSEDLAEYRAAAKEVILELGWMPRMMEYFGAQPHSIVAACREEVAQCQLLLLIIAFRRGWVPSPEQGGNGIDSITAFELACARERGIPVLAMLASDHTWPVGLCEDDAQARAWVKAFRSELNLPAVFFDYEEKTIPGREQLPAFRAKVRQVLLAHQERLLALLAQHAPRAESADVYDAAVEGLRRGRQIPFIGSGIYGDGPLSAAMLTEALLGKECEQYSTLASAAECREGKDRSRSNFLANLQDLLDQQQRRIEPPPAYRLLTRLKAARFIVSATLDQVLEQELAKAGRPFTVVSHILHSFDGEHDGKILLKRENGRVEIRTAADVDVHDARDAACVIYKLLGSPFHYNLDPDAELDTVVITESDHLLFLRRLANRETSTPGALICEFRKHPLLFLGYNLDLWQYRLVLKLFQAVGDSSRGEPPRPIAVRVPASMVEEEVWRRLQADLIQSDPNEFAGRMLMELGMS